VKNTIKYIAFHDIKDYEEEHRNYGFAAINKMDYICSAIVRAGYNVEIVSPSWTGNKKGYYKKRKTQIKDCVFLTVGPSFGAKYRLTKLIRILFSWFWLFFYLLLNIKKGEKIIVYHSLGLACPVYFARIIKKFKLILEIEEEYCKVKQQPGVYIWIEKRIINISDKYILPNDIMANAYSLMQDKCIIIYGQYSNYYSGTSLEKNNDVVRLVYAGIIDKDEGSAFKAVNIAKYLSSRYQIHILGTAIPEVINELQDLIKNTNEKSNCEVFYEGFKEGYDYIDRMLQCSVGLNLRKTKTNYINFAFPSKILSYLSMGLRVVSSRVDCVERSKIGDLLYYYNQDTAEAIAKVIMSIDFNHLYDSRARLKKLDMQFVGDIKRLLENN